jgi:hypothetical protein
MRNWVINQYIGPDGVVAAEIGHCVEAEPGCACPVIYWDERVDDAEYTIIPLTPGEGN